MLKIIDRHHYSHLDKEVVKNVWNIIKGNLLRDNIVGELHSFHTYEINLIVILVA